MYPLVRPPRVLVLPATLTDVPAIVSLHVRAFRPSALHIALFSKVDPSKLHARLVSRFTNIINKPEGHEVLLKAVRGAKILGYAKWELPVDTPKEGDGEEREVEDRQPPFAEGTNTVLASDFFAKLGERHKSLPKPHLCAYHFPFYAGNCHVY